ncbi:MAG TPA: amino acid adenylation domain-containing protein, partial [Thermoanaerobaculia bacterium]
MPEATAQGIAAVAQRESVPASSVVLAAWQVLVARLAGQAESGVGLTLDGRLQEELRGAVGPLARTVPQPFAGSLADPFASLVRRAEADRREATDWQDCFAADDGDRAPAGFPAACEIAAWPEAETQGGVTFELVHQAAYGERFRAGLVVSERASGLHLELHYDSRLFDAAYAERLGERLKGLLAAAVAHPDRSLSDVEILTEAEKRELAAWSAGPAAAYPDVRLHELVRAQAERTPEATAVVFEGTELAYRELEARANRLARHLRGLGVTVETRVGVCLERSLELVVALYAVLKAGGAYVPLDPTYPPERLAYMLDDAAVPVLLTSTAVLQALGELGAQGRGEGKVRLVRVDAPEVEETSAEPLADVEVPADALAYMIYTSGSTGRPKGAMNSHRAIVNRLLWMQGEYGLKADDRVLQKTPFSFDVSVWEFFWPLLVGARLVVASPGRHQDPAYLIATIMEQGITTLHFVPSMLHAFVDTPDVKLCTSLVRVMASGEALALDLAQRFQNRLPAALHNLYGPTEAAVDVTYWACERGGNRATVPIGRPVANTRIHLLDRDLAPVPAGASGELYIGGVQVGRGYHGRPELTAERFLPDPLACEPGKRLYRSGDLARHEAGGAVEYLGRIDHQVKIRGFRIELGEIEAALAAHPAVREAVVMAREDRPGDLRLVAYLTSDQTPPPTVDDLRRFLAARLPEYMLPVAFLRLPQLPLSANGKLDRAALPAPGSSRPDLEREYVAPRNPLEETLAAIWCEVLGIEKIGVLDSFFALGGDSIRSVRVVALAKEKGLTLTV